MLPSIVEAPPSIPYQKYDFYGIFICDDVKYDDIFIFSAFEDGFRPTTSTDTAVD
jgi:hypothetical protein